MRRAVTCAALAWLAALGHATPRASQGATPVVPAPPMTSSIWDGVYTEAQAARGATVYADGCARCHGDALEGHDPDGAPLAGREFMTARNGSPLSGLFSKIQLRMPDDDPGSLTGQETADVVAHILRVNKVPAGKSELPADVERLRQIRFDATKPGG
jgi:mono/diheme cytochrome c family protein